MNADLAVVLVSFNTAALLRTCLTSLQASLRRTPNVGANVVVVDNASCDDSSDIVAREFPDVHLIDLADNRGFSAANNVGIRATCSRYVLLLNPDTEVLGDAPAALTRYLDVHSDVGLVGARLLNPDLSFQQSCFRFPTLPMSFLDFFPLNHRLTNSPLNGRYPRSCYDTAFAIDHPLGACMLARRESLDRVGLFDEGYFMYCEEVDLCYRIKQAGWQIYYCPDAEIIHHGGASSRQSAGPMLVQLHRSRDRFFRRTYGPIYAWLARQIVRLGMGAAARRAAREHRAGRLTAPELARQLAIYRDVALG